MRGYKVGETFKLRIWRVLKRTVSVFTGVFFKKKSHLNFPRQLDNVFSVHFFTSFFSHAAAESGRGLNLGITVPAGVLITFRSSFSTLY
jgi:hypothetical protein